MSISDAFWTEDPLPTALVLRTTEAVGQHAHKPPRTSRPSAVRRAGTVRRTRSEKSTRGQKAAVAA
jgi:hypothetical protein